jgi:hypothetical protein
MAKAQQIVSDSLVEISNGVAPLETTMGTLLKGTEAKAMSDAELKSWGESLNNALVTAANATNDKTPKDSTGTSYLPTINTSLNDIKDKITGAQGDATARNKAIHAGAAHIASVGSFDPNNLKDEAWTAALKRYTDANGTEEDFIKMVREHLGSGEYDRIRTDG